jgi:hypothetical protein
VQAALQLVAEIKVDAGAGVGFFVHRFHRLTQILERLFAFSPAKICGRLFQPGEKFRSIFVVGWE